MWQQRLLLVFALVELTVCAPTENVCPCNGLMVAPSEQSCLLGHMLEILTELIKNQKSPVYLSTVPTSQACSHTTEVNPAYCPATTSCLVPTSVCPTSTTPKCPTEKPISTECPEEPITTECPETEKPIATQCPETEPPIITDCPETEEPIVTDCPTEEPIITDCPETEEPVVTDCPTEEPIITDCPETEEPIVTDCPTEEPIITECPETEEPIVTDCPPEEPITTECPTTTENCEPASTPSCEPITTPNGCICPNTTATKCPKHSELLFIPVIKLNCNNATALTCTELLDYVKSLFRC